MVRTILFYLIYVPATFVSLVIGIPLSMIDQRYLQRIARLWAQLGLWLAGVRIVAKGQENLPTEGPAIYMANHQSNFDIPALLTLLPPGFGFLAKIELFRIPLFSWGMRQMNCVPIDRSNRVKAMASLQRVVDQVRQGLRLMIFPEGTRSRDGRLLPFKKGGFLLAIDAVARIVPIAIDGSWSIMPKTTWRIRPGTVHITILPPVETADFSEANKDLLIDQIEQQILSAQKQGEKTP